MTSTKLMVLLSLTTLILGQEEDVCGGPLSTHPFEEINDALNYYAQCTFPARKLNVGCICSSCPSLSGMGPLISTGGVNQTALDAAVSIINTCLGQDGLICGINMSHIPTVKLGWTTSQIIPTNVANGTIKLNPGTGYLSSLSKAKIAVQVNPSGTFNVSIQATEVTNPAYYDCTFNIAPGSFFNSLAGLLPLTTFHNTPNMYGNCFLNISSTVTVDLSTRPPTINPINDNSNLYVVFSNFVNGHGVVLYPDLVKLFNEKMNNLLNNGVIASSAVTFLSTYAALSLQAAQENCSQ